MSCRDKALRALELSQSGQSWEAIAEELSWSISTAKAMASRIKRWDYHQKAQSDRSKRRWDIYRGKRKKIVPVNWTPEMMNDLSTLWDKDGTTGDQIARILSLKYNVRLTRQATIAKARRMKLPSRPPYRPGWTSRGASDANTTGTREQPPIG